MQANSEGPRSIWDEYRLLGEQFRGPATVAWMAEHVISGRRARLTTVHAPPMASPVTSEAIAYAFRRAAEQSRDFSHPDHMPVIGIAEQSGLPVAVTMLADGASLSDRLTQPVPLSDAMKQVSQLAHAVAAMHAAGQRHGYLIPENLWVREDGRIVFLDAGIHAAAAHAAFSSGFPLATSPYLPVADDAYAETSQTTDVYSLVALLVRMITGRLTPPEHLLSTVAALPDTLPASLRAELRDAVTIPPPTTAPTARALAVHLAFDTAWIRAQERTRREHGMVEGELSGREGTAYAGDDALSRWARAHPTAGVRGGAAASAGRSSSPLVAVQYAVARVADAGRSAVLGLRLRTLRSRSGGAEAASPAAACGVYLGPYADQADAVAVGARVRRDWPAAEVIADAEQFYVQVATTPNRRYAEDLADRLRRSGDPVEVRPL